MAQFRPQDSRELMMNWIFSCLYQLCIYIYTFIHIYIWKKILQTWEFLIYASRIHARSDVEIIYGVCRSTINNKLAMTSIRPARWSTHNAILHSLVQMLGTQRSNRWRKSAGSGHSSVSSWTWHSVTRRRSWRSGNRTQYWTLSTRTVLEGSSGIIRRPNTLTGTKGSTHGKISQTRWEIQQIFVY